MFDFILPVSVAWARRQRRALAFFLTVVVGLVAAMGTAILSAADASPADIAYDAEVSDDAAVLLTTTPTATATEMPGEQPPAYLPVILAPDLPPTPTPTPTATATPEAPEPYNDEFTDGIDGWGARQWRSGADFDLSPNVGCSDGECGLLDLKINSGQAYALVSPLQQAPPFPYRHMIRARFDDPEDGDQLGLAFAGDWDGVAPCPVDCFDNYYEFLVRYREEAGIPFLDYRIRRIDDKDGNNQPLGSTIVDWTEIDVTVFPLGWNKFEVSVSSNGTMRLYANNSLAANSGRDTTYLNDNHYFGVITRATDNEPSFGQFDQYMVTLGQ